MTATYRLPTEKAIAQSTEYLKQLIYRACEILIQQHSILSATVVTEGVKEPYFVRVPEIDLDACVIFHPRSKDTETLVQGSATSSRDNVLDEVLQTELNVFYARGAPVWKLHVLYDPEDVSTFTASFMYHHVLGDGESGRNFLFSLARALEEVFPLPTGAVVNSRIKPPNSPLLPTMESVLPLPISIWYLISKVWESIFPRFDSSVWTGSEIIVPLVNRFRHVAFSKHATTALRTACRTHHGSITALLQVLIARIIFRNIPTQYRKLNGIIPMSARRWLTDLIPDDSIGGTYVLSYDETFTREALQGNEFPWNEVRAVKDTINREMEQKGKDRVIGLVKYVRDFENGVFRSQVVNPRQSSFEVSNLAPRRFQPEDSPSGTVQIGRMMFAQSANVVGAPINISSVTGDDGCLVLAFTWLDNVVEASVIESIIDDLDGEVASLIQ